MTISLSKNPESLFPADILSTIRKEKLWRVAHTKSRREKALAHYLARAGIGYYLPMVSRQQSSNKRVRNSLIPIFNGYLFFPADDFERHKAMRSNHIARIIDVGDEIKFISELNQIEKALSGNTKVYPYDFIQKGQWVRVNKGPLKGAEGRIVRKDSNYRLVLSVESIMQSISVSIEADQVEPFNN
ncbi:MAG: UpxY family transcription antiterminator [Desulfobacteraceae bacterium]|nr:UpxY family transcription antiterminator [Desulfobacteraceae bacterium]